MDSDGLCFIQVFADRVEWSDSYVKFLDRDKAAQYRSVTKLYEEYRSAFYDVFEAGSQPYGASRRASALTAIQENPPPTTTRDAGYKPGPANANSVTENQDVVLHGIGEEAAGRRTGSASPERKRADHDSGQHSS